MGQMRVCPKCKGELTEVREGKTFFCQTCKGRGKVPEEEKADEFLDITDAKTLDTRLNRQKQ